MSEQSAETFLYPKHIRTDEINSKQFLLRQMLHCFRTGIASSREERDWHQKWCKAKLYKKVLAPMVGIWLLLALIGTPAMAQGFQKLDSTHGWLIERKLSEQKKPICRASVVGGGTWFSARVHLNRKNELVIPEGLKSPSNKSVDAALEALRLCRSSLLYF